MLLKEKIARESETRISLYREGLFWKLYNISAFNFSRLVKPYYVKKKYIKEIKETVVSIGFPDAILQGNLEHLKLHCSDINIQDNIIEVELKNPVEGYQEWFNNIEIISADISKNVKKESSEEKKIVKTENEYTSIADQILKELRNFPIIQKTPLEVQMFVLELQKKLNENQLS